MRFSFLQTQSSSFPIIPRRRPLLAPQHQILVALSRYQDIMAPSNQPMTQALLARAHSPDTVNRIFTDKIQYRPLYLRPSSPPPSNARTSRRKAREDAKKKQKLKPKPLSARERRRRGLYEVPREGQKYAIFEPLRRLWLGYIEEILGSELYGGGTGAAAKLTAAEFHGAEVEVSRSSCPSRVGIKGIVIKDSRFAFEVITPKNEVKIVPKEGTWFKVEIPVKEPGADAASEETSRRFVFEVLGDQFLMRGADRANKKFKNHYLKNI
ncbi:Ribonuclease P protein subunit p29 [Colletotrichum truncatum]|uniref:Ribonuclease P protein subunit p29 n=1 Tax=Colletotrichum truncatum TaxID=5467 RepID=A0ACC3ZKP9_COLTU|nr:Ribonuclease P protein subunit p29 [Colletotrichum truncatum]KAF6800083.1 Ribonuclease P protein subunit p29 [Colletotrichum truncatum]